MFIVSSGTKKFFASEGEILSDALIRNGIYLPLPCGGRGTCGKCIVYVNGKPEKSCEYKISSDIEVIVPEYGAVEAKTLSRQTAKPAEKICFALDIGTTTLALALIDASSGEIIKASVRANPQAAFGGDVMSRITYCKGGGEKKLASALIEEINSMIKELLKGIPSKEADILYAAGNTVMLHIFFSEDCTAMGTSPYTPVFLAKKRERAKKLGLFGVKEVISLPCISAFAGADVTAGLNFVRFPEKGKNSILVDLGTNAETVIFSDDKILCTSAAAGPCFEGANISCGMPASEGAVYAYSSDGEIKTIGGGPARGICGTGLIDIIAALLKKEIIDATGFMKAEKYPIVGEVFLSADDVRQFQLAKSAVYSAIKVLMNMRKVGFEDIETLYISGGFSSKINIKNAAITQLLPAELAGKCVALNNSSLLGTVKYAAEKNGLDKLIKKAEYVDLSSRPDFSELFIKNMTFE